MTTGYCTLCKTHKPLHEFGATPHQCLPCRRERAKDRYHKNRSLIQERRAERRFQEVAANKDAEPLEIRFAREVRQRKLLQIEVRGLRQEIEAIKQQLGGCHEPV